MENNIIYTNKLKFCVIIGTRPEAIKLCPIINNLKKCIDIDVSVCITGLHEAMVIDVLNIFKIKPDIIFHVMAKNLSLAVLTSKLISNLNEYIKKYDPNVVIVLGDTTTALCGALAAFYNKKPIAHIEAGLRTYDILNPYPEEMNRMLISKLATWHFCPTIKNKNNLIVEGIKKNIFVVGNTVIDALYFARDYLSKCNTTELANLLKNNNIFKRANKMILITSHRRENHNGGITNICNAVAKLADKFKDIDFVYSVHPNPNVMNIVNSTFKNKNYKNIFCILPLNYLSFVTLMNKAILILSDSGGILEEAPSLGKTVFVLRKVTERLEGMKIGTNKVIGTNTNIIIKNVMAFLNTKQKYKKIKNPYGNGLSSNKIINILRKKLK